MNKTILIVEDEFKLANLLVDYFNLTDYVPHIIDNGDDVISWVKAHSPCAILLDIMLPGKDGITLCKEIRQFSDVPILMLTAKVEEIDRLLGLELGADDYICKPFSPREVVARVKAVLRRTNKLTSKTLDFFIDEACLTVNFMDVKVPLTSVEFQLLKPLYKQPGRVFTRDQLMYNMYPDQRIVNHRTIDSHIKKLRKKLLDISQGEELIQSVYGAGYRFVLPNTEV